MAEHAANGEASRGSNLGALGAQIGMYFFRDPVTYLEESAAESPKWIKRSWPRLYYHLSLRPWRRWIDHVKADVFLLSFPKCGRTWLRLMIGRALALHFGLNEEDLMSLRKLHRRHPEIPRILVEHDDDPFWKRTEELSPDKKAYRNKKVVFLVRDPRDVVVSSWFHKSKRENRYAGTLTEYLQEPVGSIETLIEYYNIWERNRKVPQGFLRVSYEEMHRDPALVLRQVLDFLERKEVSDKIVQDAVEYSTFSNMRRLEDANKFDMQGKSAWTGEDGRKVRKGKVGGFREVLSPTEIEQLDRLIRDKLSPSYGYGS